MYLLAIWDNKRCDACNISRNHKMCESWCQRVVSVERRPQDKSPLWLYINIFNCRPTWNSELLHGKGLKGQTDIPNNLSWIIFIMNPRGVRARPAAWKKKLAFDFLSQSQLFCLYFYLCVALYFYLCVYACVCVYMFVRGHKGSKPVVTTGLAQRPVEYKRHICQSSKRNP